MSDQEIPSGPGRDGKESDDTETTAKDTTCASATLSHGMVDQDLGKPQQERDSSVVSAETTTRMEQSILEAQDETADQNREEKHDEAVFHAAPIESTLNTQDTVASIRDEVVMADEDQDQVRDQEQVSEGSDLSISSDEAAALNEQLKDWKIKVAMTRMPGWYAPDAIDNNLSAPWSVVLLSLVCFGFGLFLGNVLAPSLSPASSASASSASASSASGTSPSLSPLEARQVACQQICINSNGSCHATDKRSPRDWLFEAEVGLQALDKLIHARLPQINGHASPPINDFASPVVFRQRGHNLGQIVSTCQVNLQNLWNATDNFRQHVQHLATGLNLLNQPTTRSGNRLRRNNEQLDKFFALVVMARDAPVADLHRSVDASRSCAHDLVHTTLRMTDTHSRSAIMADGALRKFSELSDSAAQDLQAALLVLYHQANATAHFVGDPLRALDSTRRDVNALLALW